MSERNAVELQSQLDFQAAAGHNHNDQLNQKSAVGSADGMLCRHYAKLRTLCVTIRPSKMFGLFKKTSWKIDGEVYDFFDKLFKQLPSEFRFLSDGLDKGLYRGYSVNFAMKGHHFTIGFDPSQSDKSMTKGIQFELQNILVIQEGNEFTLNLTVYEGLWVGFEIEKNIIDFKTFQFDLTKLHKDKSKFAKDSKIEKLVRGLSSNNLDLSDLSEFEVDGKLYYQIKDLEDGNYIAIDNKGQVFGLIHDPYKIELINKSVKQFVDDVNNKKFDFDKYLDGKNGYA